MWEQHEKQIFPCLSSSFYTTLLLSFLPYSVILLFILLNSSSLFYNILASTTSLGRHRTPFPEILRLPHRLPFIMSLSDTNDLVEGLATSLSLWFNARLCKVMQGYARLCKAKQGLIAIVHTKNLLQESQSCTAGDQVVILLEWKKSGDNALLERSRAMSLRCNGIASMGMSCRNCSAKDKCNSKPCQYTPWFCCSYISPRQ